MKILWLSRHKPLRIQVEWLERRFGEIQIHHDDQSFVSAQEVRVRFEKSGVDELVLVAPLSVFSDLAKMGIYPLRAKMVEVDSHPADLQVRDRFYRFEGFARLRDVQMVFESLIKRIQDREKPFQILWVSQFQPLPRQTQWLTEWFGRISLDQMVSSFQNARKLKDRFQSGGYDEMIVVIPQWVIFRLVELGLHPLWVEMEEVYDIAQADLTVKGGRFYRFVEFRRIVELRIVEEDV